jgi:DNA-directed RNA polymerase specialized sigma24 family protein
MKGEQEKYRSILKKAWYIDRFNHKELAHTFLAASYLKGIRLLQEDYNSSYVIRGLRWAHRDMWASEKRHKGQFADWAPTITDNAGQYMTEHELAFKAMGEALTSEKEKRILEDSIILKMLAEGFTNEEIRHKLCMSANQIHYRVARVRSFMEAYKNL